ncbi:3-hydroxyacyl-CoA dehydrogenase PaaC [Pseudomonas synxantha]|uniref:3-hydroxyacyl-CoA dehydrogenase PaaC n=1 Tax=Pseudomonas synxantha TaxID=47883 RepID=A0ABS0UC57_9PSED|nr:3-hydroxyacyl-CoA dehydrogenase PaaH [Pseudomonas synxantha]MBI6563161.1 3-hydroxyacyl-CoA dehydrogenase PaaC [Pseudomonas synxantha]MBI6583399.1 3-hydroxyacyl-CoA dehydrogenase PaaC [Pseudomonas synxantha]MBI6646765.1 3-hydroxyacyl-CoA dehydrogenase PaaC [Pseudomonas synxantha]
MNALPSTAQVAVIGAGAMGAGIAQVAAQGGHPVLLFDVREGAASRARENIVGALSRLVEKGRLTAETAEQIGNAISVVDSLDAMADVDLVIEAIVEDLDAKRAVFCQLETLLRPDAIMTTNTSSVSITSIAAPLRHPERFAGMHFFNPAPLMALVEVVSGLATSTQTREVLLATAEAWGKKPVRAKSTPGFIVNRVARSFYAEGLRVLEEGVADVPTIDALIREGGGFRMGPFELMDLIGHDVNSAVTRSVFDAYSQDPRFKPSLIQQELVAAGRLGRKSGRGFYDYAQGAVRPEPATGVAGNAPKRILVAGDLGVAEPLLDSFAAVGIEIERVPGEGVIHLDTITLAFTDGRSATLRAAQESLIDLVLFDLVLDFGQPSRIGLAKADQTSDQALQDVVALFQQACWKVSVIDDAPALVVMRTVVMLANEGADTVLQGVASPADIDQAMRYGTNYPRGPLAWADAIGGTQVLQVLSNLQHHYGEDRYRPSSLLRRCALTQRKLLQARSH